jgi:hypothetical protein
VRDAKKKVKEINYVPRSEAKSYHKVARSRRSGNIHGNSPIYIARFSANTSVHLQKKW